MTNHDELCEKDGEKFKQNWVDVSEQSRRLVEKNEEIKELRTRVADLELCNKNANALIADQADESQRIVDKLQNRLSQAEEKEKELRENWLEDMQEWSVEKATLLKASEGIEKALELLINHTMDCEEDIDKLSGMGNDSGSGSSEYVCAAKQALAEWKKVSKANG